MQRRKFMKGAALTGAALTGTAALPRESHAIMSWNGPAEINRFDIKRDLIRVGMVGLGPYSHAMMYTEPLNDPNYPPRTNMRVTAVWGREDNYRSSYWGDEDRKTQQAENLASYMDRDKFKNELGVEHFVENPEDMIGLVDAVFITDPEHSLELARPFLQRGMPVFVNRPNAWNMHEIREIIRLAKENGSTLVTGSCVPWMQEIQVVAQRTQKQLDGVREYWVEGSGANFCSYYAHIIETALKLVPGRVNRVWAFGPKPENPDVDPPGHVTVAHFEYDRKNPEGGPVLGVLSNAFMKPIRAWGRVWLKDRLWFKDQGYVLAEPQVYWEPVVGGGPHDEHISLGLLRTIDNAFMTGEWPESAEHIENKVACTLMTHKSLIESGRPVTRDEIENHELPRYR